MSLRMSSGAASGGATGRIARRAAALVAVSAAVLVAVPGTAVAVPPRTLTHGTGLLPPTASVSAAAGLRSLAQSAADAGGAVRVAATLPAAVDLRAFAVPAGDQGQHGACASWTTAYTMAGWVSNFVHHGATTFQPMYVYNQINGGSDDDGTTFYDNFRILESQGVVEAARWTHPFADYRSQPTAQERANAALHALTPQTTLFMGWGPGAAGRTAIETAIANNRPVALGIPVYNNFFYLNHSHSTFSLADATGPLAGYHAVTVLGYTPQGVQIENSWSQWWGDNGFATLSWDFVQAQAFEAHAAGTFVRNARTPVVTGLSASAVSAAGGGSLTVTATQLGTVDTSSPSAVTFVSVANPAVSVVAPIVASTATTLRVAVPALPSDGGYRVVVTGSEGASVPNGTKDVVTAVTPVSARAATPLVSAGGGTVNLIGSGFGTSPAAFSSAHLTATVSGRAARLAWVSNTTLTLTLPAGQPGAAAPIVLFRNSVPGTTISGVRYAAAITGNSAPTGPRRGWTTTLTGAGFARAGSWTLVNGAGRAVSGLTVVASRAALTSARSGAVLIASATSAIVKLPAMSPATYRLTFRPDQRTYPGAALLPSAKAGVAYSAR
ncbi:MAG: hypothetical protein JWP40_3116 [Blastococcus sp.]|jgi:hypothetical protein|nr:hypothetical protein [Blastococcus sp.]